MAAAPVVACGPWQCQHLASMLQKHLLYLAAMFLLFAQADQDVVHSLAAVIKDFLVL
jgi:hypothetical protein